MVSDAFESRVPARADQVREIRSQVADWVRELGADRDVVDAVRLAVSEALTNAVIHAYHGREAGEITVRGRREYDRLLLWVSDEGVGLVPRPDSPGMGIGLGLMAQLADGFSVVNRRGGGDGGSAGTVVSMTFELGYGDGGDGR